jgi:tetratricopeptide (TPR) repeat protein
LKAHLQSADEALRRNDPVKACGELRMAQQLAPDDAAIAARISEMQNQAISALADKYVEQARYEERHGHDEAASRNYAQAALALPSAEVWESAARSALKAKVDLRFAAEAAKKGLELSPRRTRLRLLLVEIYLEGNLVASAAAELDRAAQLAPTDGAVRQMRQRLERRSS